MLAQMMDVPKTCEEAAMMVEEVAIVVTGEKSGLSVVGRKEVWICDSGASVRMSLSNHAMFDFMLCYDRGVRTANKELSPVVGYASMRLQVVSGEKLVRLKLSRVAVVPRLSYNLVSLGNANRNGFDFIGRARA